MVQLYIHGISMLLERLVVGLKRHRPPQLSSAQHLSTSLLVRTLFKSAMVISPCGRQRVGRCLFGGDGAFGLSVVLVIGVVHTHLKRYPSNF